MRLTLIDRILELHPGERIQAVKCLALSEEYLRDHFPQFPVMPGVLMLESMYQTAAWLVRASEDFAHSMVTLAEAKNVRFTDFIAPGQSLTITAELQQQDEQRSAIKCQGTSGSKIAVRANLVLERYNLADKNPHDQATDAYLIQQMRRKFRLLHPNAA